MKTVKYTLIALLIFTSPIIAIAGTNDKIVQVKRERVGGDGSGKYDDVHRTVTVESTNPDGTVAKLLVKIGCYGSGSAICPDGLVANPNLPPVPEVPSYLESKTATLFLLAEQNIAGGTGEGSYSEQFSVLLSSGETETYACVLTWTSTSTENVSMELTFTQLFLPSGN